MFIFTIKNVTDFLSIFLLNVVKNIKILKLIMAVSHKKVFKNLDKSLSNALSQFQKETPDWSDSVDGSNVPEVRPQLIIIIQALSHEVNKLALAFRSDPIPTPESSLSLATGLEQKTVQFLATFLSFSKKSGL